MSNRVGELQNQPAENLNAHGLYLVYSGESAYDLGGGTYQVSRRWVNNRTSISVIASIDPTKHGDLLHVSIARKDRIPKWDEIKAVRDTFFPLDVDVMMVLPRESDYVNVHPYAMHIWQMPMEWGIR